jgi:hypothetical protein
MQSMARISAFLRLFRARVTHAREEAGFALLETIVSAALLAVVALGVYAGIDGPASVSGNDRLRTTAGTLAEQDQERLKSLDFDHLQSYSDAPRQVSLGGTTYTVTSRTDWVEDSSGTISCTNNSSKADYLQTTSTVTWPSLGGGKPVAISSLLAPPAQGASATRGNLVVKITDQAGAPVTGLPVQISGPVNQSRSTNAEGCALFTYIPSGSYNTSFSRSGWVDPTGATSVSFPSSVAANSTATVSRSYAAAAQIDVSFQNSAGQSLNYTSASLEAAGMAAPRTFTASPAAATISTGKTLYPFTGTYSVWAGRCTNPYTASNPAVSVATQAGQSYTVNVKLPTLTFNTNRSFRRMTLASQAAGCGDPIAPIVTTGATTGTFSVPFGSYSVCANDGVPRRVTATVQNDTAAGRTTTLNIPGSGGSSSCP